MPEIRFPALDGVTGTTCGVYAFSYFSGCTDDQGITRGFTQEWYFDGNIGAWVSVTQGVTGGGADLDNVTDPYSVLEHVAPPMTGTGNVRKIAFVDPDTGGLTFDYIKTYDVLNPAETEYSVNNFTWQSAADYLAPPPGQLQMQFDNITPKSLTTGTTLCGSIDHEYVIGSLTDTSPGFKFYINRLQSGTDFETTVSPLAPPPGNSADQFILDSQDLDTYRVTVPSGVPLDRVLPFEGGTYAYEKYFTGNSGEIIFASGGPGSPVIGFTTQGGPVYQGFTPKLEYSNNPDPNVGVNDSTTASGTASSRHENWLIFASVLRSQVGSDWNDVITYIQSNPEFLVQQRTTVDDSESNMLGLKILLDPQTKNNSGQVRANPANIETMERYQRLEYKLTSANFVRRDGENYFPIVAIPTRALPGDGSSSDAQKREIFANALLQDGSLPGSNGFFGEIYTTLDITNEFGYEEEYTIFISENGVGIGNNNPQFRLKLNRFS